MFHTTRNFCGLNIEQRHALRTSGFLLINAVAGSGKTTMLVALLLKSLMEDRDDKGNPVRLDRFALITFTRKAAANLRKKIREAMEKELETATPEMQDFWNGHLRDLPGAAIGTIDSLVQERLRRLALAGVARFDPAIEVLDEVGREILAERAVRRVMEQAADQPDTDLGRALTLLGQNHKARDIRERFMDLLAKDGDGETALRAINQVTHGDGGYERLEAMLSHPPRDEWSRVWCPLAEGFGARLATAVQELAGRTTNSALEIMAFSENWDQNNANLPEQFANLRAVLFNNEGAPRRQGLAGRDGVCFSESLAALQADILPAVAHFDRMVYQTEEQVFLENTNFQLYRAWGEFFHAAHKAYLEECRTENRFSFHDLARMLEAELGSIAPDRLRDAGLPFDRVMIDEFQDNTSLQWRIGCLLAGGDPDDPKTWGRLTVVGDPEQAIYHWRGSNAKLMADVRRQYEGSNPASGPTWYDTIRGDVGIAANDRESTPAEKIGIGQLALNFRTRETTLERIDRCSTAAMGQLGIHHVPLKSGEALRADAGKPNTAPALAELLVLPPLPEATADAGEETTDENDEADNGYDPASLSAVASRLRMLRDEHNLDWRDMLVLARGFTKLIQPLHEVFRKAGIPYRAMVREAIWDLQEIRDILNLARYLADAGNGPALLGVLRGPACRLTDGEVVLLASWRENGTVQQGLSQVADATKAPEYPPSLDAWNHMEADRIEHLRAVAGRLNAWRRLVDRMPHHELLRLALEESGAFHAMATWLVPEGTGAETARRVAAGIEFVLDRAREIEQARPLSMAEMSSILDRHAAGEIRESIDPDLSADEDMVRVMSIHASKGLEAKAVVLLVPELGKKGHHRPRGSGMIILDRQYLRAEVSATEAAEYLGLPLMDLRASHEKDDKNQPPSLYRIARGTDNSHFEREEARLFHVAITRSEGTLIVAAPRTLRDKDSRHWPIVWSSAHLVHVDAAALPPALGQEIPCPRDLPPPRPPKASPGRVAMAATRLQDIMELPTRQEQVEALGLVRRGLQAFPAGVPAELLKANQTRAGLGKVVGTLAHRALEMKGALPADQEERLRYLAGQARALLSDDPEGDEPGEGPRVAGEAAQAAESARTIIERLDQPSHAEIRGLAGQPGAAEVDFALPVGDQWLVTGRFDRLLDNGDVVDWKTDNGDPEEIRNRYRGQMGLYALAVSEARRLRGEPEQTVRVSLALLSTGEVIPLDYSPEQITAARAGLESLLNIP